VTTHIIVKKITLVPLFCPVWNEYNRVDAEAMTTNNSMHLLLHSIFYLHLIQKGITASTLVCWSMISLTHTPYPVTVMAWSSKGSDWMDSSSPFFGLCSLLIISLLLLLLPPLSVILSFPVFPFVLLDVAEKKDVMDFWSSSMSSGVLFLLFLLLLLLLLLIPDVLPSNGGGSPRHGNFRR
jgi:hypothetical protein